MLVFIAKPEIVSVQIGDSPVATLRLKPHLPTSEDSGIGSCRILSRYETNDWDEILSSRQSSELLQKIKQNDLSVDVSLPLCTTPTRCEFKVILSYCNPDIGEMTSNTKIVDIGKTIGW